MCILDFSDGAVPMDPYWVANSRQQFCNGGTAPDQLSPARKNQHVLDPVSNFEKKINNFTCNNKEQQNSWKLTSAGGRFSCWRPTPNDSNRFWIVEKMSCRRNGLTEPLELYLSNMGKNVESMFQLWKVMFEWYEYILMHLLYKKHYHRPSNQKHANFIPFLKIWGWR